MNIDIIDIGESSSSSSQIPEIISLDTPKKNEVIELNSGPKPSSTSSFGPGAEMLMNGKKKEKGFWKYGENEGLCSFWFENGQQKKEGVYKSTKGIGFWTYWYPNGNIEREGYRSNGIKNGYWMYFYDKSGKKSQGNYFNDFKYGLWTFWYTNGNK